MKAKVLGWLGLALVLVVVYVFAMPSYRHGEPSVAGRKAPDFEVVIGGKTGHLSDYRGKVVVLDFWASWCAPCVSEAPSLNALAERIQPEGGVVLGISQDDDPAAYGRFLADHQVAFPTSRDTTSMYPMLGKIAQSYGTALIPDVYLISRDGRIAKKIVGEQDWTNPDLISSIETLLKSK
jgi:cytochrome c biogenesis protein CcmG, thiol:disulfide interchange protein DsbE